MSPSPSTDDELETTLLNPGTLKQQAVEATGLDYFGTPPLDDGLAVLCQALDEQAALNPAAEQAMSRSLVGTLVERLRLEDWLRREPTIREVALAPQVFVLGLPRSGTTALSQFMSTDPRARSIRRWELNALTPPPNSSSAKADPRIKATRQAFAARDEAMPTLKTMLPVAPEDPSEHGVLLGLTFRNLHWPSLSTIPDYTRWLLSQRMDPAFEYLVDALRLLQWKTPAGYWNLKNPVDSAAIDAVLRVFPTAPIFWMHRDPAVTIPSVCSLLCVIRDSTGLEYDRKAFGRYVLEFEAGLIELAMERRNASPHKERVFDVYNRDLSTDTIGTLRQAYGAAGLAFSAAFENALRQRIANRPRGSTGKHEYTAAEFGLNSGMIRDRFAAYIERFQVPLEG